VKGSVRIPNVVWEVGKSAVGSVCVEGRWGGGRCGVWDPGLTSRAGRCHVAVNA